MQTLNFEMKGSGMDIYNSFFSDIDNIISDIKNNHYLIHCITNPISINDCANAVLAAGGRPIMAEHPLEVSEITSSADALCLNLGNITDARMESMLISAKTANASNIPIILDVVGITCSTLRYEYVNKLLSCAKPAVIKGNLSEIKKLANSRCSFSGIDSDERTDTENELAAACDIVNKLALQTGSVIAASGKTDIISDGKYSAYVDNGCPLMPLITGTGCLLNVITGTMLSAKVSTVFNKTVLGSVILGVCGELALVYNESLGLSCGLGSYHVNLLNALSAFYCDDIKKMAKVRFI
jgi:hydroxyethylthiazole kinase